MPYASIDQLPPAVRGRYSPRCQRVFMHAFNDHDGDEASRFKIAHTAAGRCKESGKAMDEYTEPTPVKATLVSDDHFRLLAIPFGGPLGGKDLDGEFFSERTDIKPDWFAERPVLWHHGQDDYMTDTVIGKATDLTREEDGWWVDVWIKAGEKRAELVKRLAQKAPIYGSSGTIGYLRKATKAGEILVWPYVEQTLTTSPQNTLSVTKPAKAWLDDFNDAYIPVHAALKAVLTDIDNLGADLPLTSLGDIPTGDAAAKAGRVLSARNERSLREALTVLQRYIDLMAGSAQPDPPTEGDAS
jgi:cation transport regulator ChaB